MPTPANASTEYDKQINFIVGQYSAEAYGFATGATGSVNSAALQSAIDAASTAGGGIVTIWTPGTFLLAGDTTDPTAGAYGNGGTRNCCVLAKANVSLIVGNGVTLKLDDGEMTGDNSTGTIVNMFVADNVNNFSLIGAGIGKSVIDFNAAGQTGFTGGYYQIQNGCCVIKSNVTGPCHDFVLSGFTLKNCFSNPFTSVGSSGTAHQRTILRDLHGLDFGEGIQLIQCENFTVENIICESAHGVGIEGDNLNPGTVGDLWELSDCHYGYVHDVKIIGEGVGSALDYFGATYITTVGLDIDTSEDIVLQDGTGGPSVKPGGPYIFSGVNIRNSQSTSTLLINCQDTVQISGLRAEGGAIPFQILPDTSQIAGDGMWQASKAYSLGDIVVPVTRNGARFRCTTAGTSAGTEPTWDTTVGNTTLDGATLVWTAQLEQQPIIMDNCLWLRPTNEAIISADRIVRLVGGGIRESSDAAFSLDIQIPDDNPYRREVFMDGFDITDSVKAIRITDIGHTDASGNSQLYISGAIKNCDFSRQSTGIFSIVDSGTADYSSSFAELSIEGNSPVSVNTAGGAATYPGVPVMLHDNTSLNRLLGGHDGCMVKVVNARSSGTLTITHNQSAGAAKGVILTQSAASVSLTTPGDWIMLQYNNSTNVWNELAQFVQ